MARLVAHMARTSRQEGLRHRSAAISGPFKSDFVIPCCILPIFVSIFWKRAPAPYLDMIDDNYTHARLHFQDSIAISIYVLQPIWTPATIFIHIPQPPHPQTPPPTLIPAPAPLPTALPGKVLALNKTPFTPLISALTFAIPSSSTFTAAVPPAPYAPYALELT